MPLFPWRMETLEFRLRVSGHPILGEEAKGKLLSGGVLGTLDHSLRARIPERAAPLGVLAAQVKHTGVFISDDWVVSIYGRRMIQCVSAMLALSSLIGRQLGESVNVEVSGLQSGRDEPLEESVHRKEGWASFFGVIKWGTTILVSAAVGAFIQWMVCNGVLP